MNERALRWGSGLGVLGLFALGCSGMGELAEVGKGGGEAPSDLRVSEAHIPRGKGEARPDAARKKRAHKKDEYVIKLRPGAGIPKFLEGSVTTRDRAVNSAFGKLDIRQAAAAYGFTPKNSALAKHLGLDRTIHIRTSRPYEKVKRLEKHPSIEWVEPVVEVTAMGRPNDPYYSYQWHMQMLHVEEAWETTRGKGVVVAVIDTGVSAGQDGFAHLAEGYDFVDDDTQPEDGQGHGSHVAGTIAQKADNGIGVVGVAPEATILPVRVLDSNGSGSNTWVANGIVWAVDHGANIINMSLGGPMPSEVVADACQYAYEQGVTVIAATGNDGYSDFIGFPAAYPSTIAVGSVDARKVVAFYSNQGREIDLVAPGGDVTVDKNGDGQGDGVVQETLERGEWGYSFFMGTSMATPHVAGVAALLYARGVTEPDAIRRVLRQTADDLGKPGFDTTYGAGLVNPVRALKRGKPGLASAPTSAEEEIQIRPLGDDRAMIVWKTAEPVPTMLRGSDGTKIRTTQKSRLHRVTVDTRPGKQVKYTVNLGPGRSQQKTISHTF